MGSYLLFLLWQSVAAMHLAQWTIDVVVEVSASAIPTMLVLDATNVLRAITVTPVAYVSNTHSFFCSAFLLFAVTQRKSVIPSKAFSYKTLNQAKVQVSRGRKSDSSPSFNLLGTRLVGNSVGQI